MLCVFLLFFVACSFLSVTTGDPEVIIIGAGPAGIAAATKLLENSVSSVKILEAEGRIGGRIHSVNFGDAFVDLGAEFCHGQEGNIVYELAKDLNVFDTRDDLDETVYYSNGTELDPTIQEELKTIIFKFDDKSAPKRATDVSLGQAFLDEYKSTILNKYQNDPKKLKIFNEAIKLSESVLIGYEGSFNWFEPTASGHYRECEGNQAVSWTGQGYKTILEILMKSYPDPSQKLPIDNKILLNKKVVGITWNQPERVVVLTEDNTTFTADHIIFTPSIGVLKEYKSLFDPPLPETKKTALETLGFDGIMKVIIRFSRKFWKDHHFAFLWSEEDLKASTKEFPDGPQVDGVSWVTYLMQFSQAPNNSKVLVGWMTGSVIPKVEQLPLETIKKGVKFAFEKFFGGEENVGDIEDVLVSRWCTNPNFLGTYSFEKAGYFKENTSYQDILSESLNISGKPVVLFAGEATNPIHYSTVHGAIESGHREAEKLLRFYKK